MTITQEIGSRIRKLRINNDHTQESMAQALALTPGAYAKIERGETDPSVTRLFEIAKILKVDIIDLMKDSKYRGFSGKEGSVITRSEFESLQNTVQLINQQLDLKGEKKPAKKSVARKGKR